MHRAACLTAALIPMVLCTGLSAAWPDGAIISVPSSVAFGAAAEQETFCRDDCQQTFPPDSGILNVRDFGAKGDGRTDDTAALLSAINAAGPDTGPFFWRTRIVYLPNGIYRVSETLERHYANGNYGSGMILVGQSSSGTVIRLADNAPGFGDVRSPRGVVMTTAKLLDGTPTSGGKDYSGKGEGNDAYENFIEDLTIDVGRGNPGAIGIDYLASNIGAIRDVRVIAPTDSGATGIAMQRKWPGPTLLERVAVSGFATGIAVAQTEYGVTLDHVTLEGQRKVGLANERNSVAAAHLTIVSTGVAIANTSPEGLIVLTDSALRETSDNPGALVNRGTIVARRLTLQAGMTPANAPVTGIFSAGDWQSVAPPEEVSLADAPPPLIDPVQNWANVLEFAAPTRDGLDITDALRRALGSGAKTVYLPCGRYTIHAPVDVPSTVRRIVGMNASITVRPEREPDFARDTGMLRITQPGQSLTIERLAFDMTDLGKQLAVEVSAPRDVVLRDIVTAGTSLLNRGPAGGRVFIENVCCGEVKIAGPAPVIARQLDTEGDGTRIINDGGNMVLLGLKTEGDCTVLENRNGGRSTILGGLLYIVRDADSRIPAFRDSASGLSASFVEESLRAGSHYTIYLESPAGAVEAAQFPPRATGRMVPWLFASTGANR